MADLNSVQAVGSTIIVGAETSGNETTPVASTLAGALHTNLRTSAGTEISSDILTPDLSSQALIVRPLPYEPPRYTAATNSFLTAVLATDIARIIGSASKVVRIKKVIVSGRTTSGSPVPVILKLIKYSTANTGGVSVATTVVPLDSTSEAGTATVNHYTTNPTLGTVVGNIKTSSVTFQATGNLNLTEFEFETPVVLRGTAQQLSVNFNATTVVGASICVNFEWEEV